ncbi:MAG: TonB-dependent receptor [Herbaspirillum sp.]|jgi:TonB-dependent receptor|nr:TonB-dependent receptor [Herbaspirillum sp.]
MTHLNHLKRKQIAIVISGLMANMVFSVAMAADADGTPAADGKNVTSLTDVNVQSQRNPEAVARAQQETAPNLINVTTAEEIRKLPDVNAGEAVRRLPGISLETDTGEGRFVNIRGLDADLTSTTFGGVRLPPTNTASPFSGGRAVAFDTIPAGMIGSITVTKTNTPDQDAEALGGTIEITPKTLAPGQSAFLDGKLGGGKELMRQSGVSDVSVSGGTRFGFGSSDPASGLTSYSDKPFSFVGSYSRYEDNRGVDDLEAGYASDGGTTADPKTYSSLQQRYYNYHRTRYGVGGELTFEPDANNKWYVRYYDSGYTETVNRQALNASFPGTATRNADGSITESGVTYSKALRDEHETISSQVFTIGGKDTLGETKVDYHLAHTKGSDNRPYDQNSTFTNPTSATVTYNNIANPNLPQYSVSGLNPADPNGYTLSNFNNTSVLTQTTEWSAAANVSTPTHWTSAQDEEFKFGTSARLRKNDNIVTPTTYSSVPGLALINAISGSPITYYDGTYQNGFNINKAVIDNLVAQGAGFVQNTAADALSAAAQRTHNTEDVFAAYLQEQMTFGKLGLLAGVRVENTRAQYDGNAVAGTVITPVSNSSNYTNFFPTLQARYELAPKTIVRATYSSTIARPGFNQTSAATTIDTGNNIVTTGNPNLKPTLSDNFDLSFEHYLEHAGIVSFGVFDKAMTDYVIGNVSFQNLPNTGPYAGLPGNTEVISFTNAASARARGFELNYEQRYSFLPSILSGLGTSFNWTYVDSSVMIRPGETTKLPSTSRNSYNAAVFWERGGLDLRLATYYTSRNLLGVGATGSQDIYSEARFSADFGASYQVAKNYGLFLTVKNLTNTPMKFTEGTSDRVIQRETYGKTVEAGATFNF